MNIRYATRKDISRLSDLFQQEIENQKSSAGYYELVADFNWPQYVEDRLNSRSGCILVAETNNVIVGFIYSKIVEYPPQNKSKSILSCIRLKSEKNASLPIKSMCWGIIDDYYVVPEFRRQGAATLLVKSAILWFKEKKISRIELSINNGNVESDALTRKLGFDTFRRSLSKTL